MKLLLIAWLLGTAASVGSAADVPELKAVEAKYDQAQLKKDESLRAKYIMELAVLRWNLSRKDNPGWQTVDAEIARHPAPVDSDIKAFSKARIGKWYSSRHDYIYKADGTWVMDYDPSEPESTHGTWSIKGNRFFSTDGDTRSYTVILLNADNFIYSEPGYVYYERRTEKGGLPIRRDE